MTSFRLSEDWPPEQVMVVLDILEELHKAIWEAYEEPLVAIICKEMDRESIIACVAQAEHAGQMTFDFDRGHDRHHHHHGQGDDLQNGHDDGHYDDLDDDIPF
ncbi:MAG: hypothetical protein GY713_13290 [Actinomycetia bacterium]|nr:hypothetical protein [Actinomycetes bacterium]